MMLGAFTLLSATLGGGVLSALPGERSRNLEHSEDLAHGARR